MFLFEDVISGRGLQNIYKFKNYKNKNFKNVPPSVDWKTCFKNDKIAKESVTIDVFNSRNINFK